jgi:hypothetical protein
MDPTQPFELKHIRGIPYYVQNSILYAFTLSRDEPGKPSRECIVLGTYDATTGTIAYAEDWRERVQPSIDAFRAELAPLERGNIRQDIVKPQKSRKASRHSRKTSRAKATKSK